MMNAQSYVGRSICPCIDGYKIEYWFSIRIILHVERDAVVHRNQKVEIAISDGKTDWRCGSARLPLSYVTSTKFVAMITKLYLLQQKIEVGVLLPQPNNCFCSSA
ncbi:hypothetical protein KP509_13G059600 [Ceratopteris richardii]|uniref:Uncharacterized protein n=1 Tax=Ceratopteris richardii TaxID=49495 RepID=A0A8T2TI88_CERRI|nr:hypothetical protein KP509_13G059600 [Ceratopteris richardii]